MVSSSPDGGWPQGLAFKEPAGLSKLAFDNTLDKPCEGIDCSTRGVQQLIDKNEGYLKTSTSCRWSAGQGVGVSITSRH